MPSPQSPAGPPVSQPAPPLRNVVQVSVLALLILYTLHFAAPLIVPVVLALLFTFMLMPAVHALERRGVRPPLGAALILGLILAAAGAGLYGLTEPATRWAERATLAEIEGKLRALVEPLEQVQEATEEIEQMAGGTDEDDETVVVQEASLGEVLLTGTGKLAASALAVVVLVFFLLASGGRVGRDLLRVLPRLGDRRRALRIGRRVGGELSRYLLTIALINAGLGVAIGFAMFLLGLPNPALWGVLAALMNFIPYLGALVTAAVLFVVALLTYVQPLDAVAAPAVSLALNSIEGYLVTPSVLAQRLTMQPVLVFGSVFFWGWLWGVPGALLAVPLLATTKIVCDHVPSLVGLGRFIGRRSTRRRLPVRPRRRRPDPLSEEAASPRRGGTLPGRVG